MDGTDELGEWMAVRTRTEHLLGDLLSESGNARYGYRAKRMPQSSSDDPSSGAFVRSSR